MLAALERILGMHQSENEFWESHLLTADKKEKACDPFGLLKHSNQDKKWNDARKIDSMFTPRILSREVFLCLDCDSWVIGCELHDEAAFVRCLNEGGRHCVFC